MQVPICEIDPWRTQYFESVSCPPDVFIPTEDSDGWMWNPAHRWVYDKLAVALSQGLTAAPHGVAPQNYPVFSKPIYNLKGMGVGSRALFSADDYASAYQPGHFWTTLARRRPCQQRRGPGRWRTAVVASCDRRCQRCWHFRLLGSACSASTRGRGLVRRLVSAASQGLHRAAQPRDHRRPHHRGASALRRSVARSLWRLVGWRPSSVSMRRANGGSTIRHGAPATASCCSRRTAGDIDILQPICSAPSRRCRACRACRSPSTRSCRPAGMPCRRAAFASPS